MSLKSVKTQSFLGNALDAKSHGLIVENLIDLDTRISQIDKLEAIEKNLIPNIGSKYNFGSEVAKFNKAYLLQLLVNSILVGSNTEISFTEPSMMVLKCNGYDVLSLTSSELTVSAATSNQVHIKNTADESIYVIGSSKDGLVIKSEGTELIQISSSGITFLKTPREKTIKIIENRVISDLDVQDIGEIVLDAHVTIKGFSGGFDGKEIKIVKSKRDLSVIIENESTDADVVQKVSTKTGTNTVMEAGYGCMVFKYLDGQWIQIN